MSSVSPSSFSYFFYHSLWWLKVLIESIIKIVSRFIYSICFAVGIITILHFWMYSSVMLQDKISVLSFFSTNKTCERILNHHLMKLYVTHISYITIFRNFQTLTIFFFFITNFFSLSTVFTILDIYVNVCVYVMIKLFLQQQQQLLSDSKCIISMCSVGKYSVGRR